MEFSFEHAAMKGDPLPKKLDIADSCLYMGLKYIYAMYKVGLLQRETAREEKRTLVFNWKKNKSEVEFLNRENEALSFRIKNASERYMKSPSIETADELYAAFYNLEKDWRRKE